MMNYWSISPDLLTSEAEKLGLEVGILSKPKNTFYIASDDKKILFKSTDFTGKGVGNSSVGYKIANDKELTYKILSDKGYPIADSYYLSQKDFKNSGYLEKLDLSYPIVIKPLKEAHGNGVKIGIKDQKDLERRLEKSFEEYDKVVLQKQVQGNEIRVLVVKGEVIVAMNRMPPNIVGDDKHSIKELIEKENDENEKRGEGYKKPLSYIDIDKELKEYIDKKGYDLGSVLQKDKELQIRGNSNVGSGGTIREVTDQLSDSIKQTCRNICDEFGLDICGVDVMTSDMTQSLEATNGIIVELNATPGFGSDKRLLGVNTPRKILKKLFDCEK